MFNRISFTVFSTLCVFMAISACGKTNIDYSDSRQDISMETSDTGSVIMSQQEIDQLVKVAIEKGDCDSYQEAVVNRHLDSDLSSLYLVSQYMADTYHCPIAYYYVALALGGSTAAKDRLSHKKNEKSESIAIYYFLKAYELGHEPAIYQLEAYGFNIKKLPKSSDYLTFPKLEKLNK